MRNILLIKLTLENFKGIRYLEINADGENLRVYGENGTGKTTIADAFSWLLFGKDSAGRSDFDIKTLGKDGTPIHFIDHSVRAIIRNGDKECELEKIYREKWVRQRGSVDREFQGHETEYIIDGIPKSKSEYTAFIKDISDEEIFRLLTNPMYFNNNLDKKKRRELLFDAFGEISDADVIAANSAVLGDLAELIGTHTLEELKAASAQKKRRLSADLQAIPNRIDEANRFIKVCDVTDPDVTYSLIKDFKERLKDKEQSLREVNTDTVADEYRRKAREEIRELEAVARDECDKARREYLDYESSVKTSAYEISNINRSIEEAKRDTSLAESRIYSANKTLEQMRGEWQTIFDSKYESDNKCRFCGQHLPTEQIEAAVAKFNANKAQELEEINGNAESVKKRIAELESAIERNNDEIKKLTTEREYVEISQKNLLKDRDKAERTLAEVKGNYESIIAEKKKALSDWENSRSTGGTVAAVQESLESEIAAIRAKIRALEDDLNTYTNNEMFRERISELEADAKRLTAEYEKLERTEYLIGEFTKIKASMLEEKINSRFKYAKFKLFETQINGGIVETCEVTYDGVPYSVLNNAAKINVGLDIINAFSEAYGVTGVIFIDNAESVTQFYRTNSQVVRLYVSAGDDMLRVEKDLF